MKNLSSLITLLFLLTVTLSCTMLRTVTPPPAVILPTVKPEDQVRVLLVDGTKFRRVKVVTIDSDSIVASYPLWSPIYHQWITKTVLINVNEIRGIQNLKDHKLYVVNPKSIIKVTLKSGEKIRRLEVTAVDSEKITGRIARNTRVINVSEIAKIRMRVPNPALTSGIVSAVVVLGILVIIIGSSGAKMHN